MATLAEDMRAYAALNSGSRLLHFVFENGTRRLGAEWEEVAFALVSDLFNNASDDGRVRITFTPIPGRPVVERSEVEEALGIVLAATTPNLFAKMLVSRHSNADGDLDTQAHIAGAAMVIAKAAVGRDVPENMPAPLLDFIRTDPVPLRSLVELSAPYA